MRPFLAFALGAILAGCGASAPTAAPPPAPAATAATTSPSTLPLSRPPAEPPMQKTDTIGTATMSTDGTLTLRLRAETNGMHGEGVLIYPPDHKDYAAILKHVGPLKPGEERAVLPWPE